MFGEFSLDQGYQLFHGNWENTVFIFNLKCPGQESVKFSSTLEYMKNYTYFVPYPDYVPKS